MSQSNSSASNGRRLPQLGPHLRRGSPLPHNYNICGPPFRLPPYQQHRSSPQFSRHYRDRPPSPPPDRPNFIVQLRFDAQPVVKEADIEPVIQKLKFQPQKSNVVASNYILATLFYEQWSEALETLVQLWEMKLNDKGHSFLPRVVCNVEVPSDEVELNGRLKVLFFGEIERVERGGFAGEVAEEIVVCVVDEIKRVSDLLKKPQSLVISDELLRKRKGLGI